MVKDFKENIQSLKITAGTTRKKEIKKATTRVEHTIGLSAQVDWKEKVLMHDKNNVEHIFSIFLYVLPYSKRKFIKLTLDQKQDTLFECLTEAFHFMKGVPKEIWFDNMATVVDHQTSTFNHHHFNDRFLSFAHDAGFHPIACRPFRPQTKGCVEALARTMSRLKPYDKEFDFNFQPSINPQSISELTTMSFLDKRENVIFIGSPGVGKTHLAIGLGVKACEQGVRTLFINCHELMLRLQKAQEKQHLERVIRRYERYDLLIIDELGYLPLATDDANLLFQLINGRYERKSTIVTTNMPLSSWGVVLHNLAAAEAILDRLVYHSHIIKIKGKSYRLMNGRH